MVKHYLTQLLMLVCVVIGLASCADTLDNPETRDGNVEYTPDAPEPTEDQMSVKVTADLTAYVHSPFDEGSTGAALVKRLPLATNDFTPDTRLVMLKGSEFDEGSTLTPDEIIAIARVYSRGGYIALERPTTLQASKFLMSLMVGMTTLKQQDYEHTFGMSGTAAAAAARRSQAVERLNTRAENIKRLATMPDGATTRAGEGDNATPHSQGDNEVMGEMMIFNPMGYFVQRPFEAESKAYAHSKDSEGNVTEPQAVTVKATRTPYISGLMADASAAWLNDMLKPQGNPSAASRRASGSNVINEIMNADESFTYSTSVDWRNPGNETKSSKDRMNMTVRSWGVHNMEDNKDYYYLKQDVRLMMGVKNGEKLFVCDDMDEKEWMMTRYYDGYDYWYGAFLSQYKTSMDLTGKGGPIKLESSSPKTDNDGITTIVSTSSSYGTTSNVGFTLGGSLALQADKTLSPSVNLGINFSWGTTECTTFMLGTNISVYALEAKANTSGTMVTWTYDGSLPTVYLDSNVGMYCHTIVPAILVNDADMTQEICWSVPDPIGQYTVNITSTPQTAALLSQDGNGTNKYEFTTTATSSWSHTLLQPNRFMQNWRMYITIDEWMDEPVTGALSQLESTLLEAFSDIFAKQFQVGEISAESIDGINYIINYSKAKFNDNYDVLLGYAKDLGIKKFSIYWRCDDTNIQTPEPYAVEMPTTPGNKAQAIWCEGNTTLYFASAPELKAGDTWDVQTVTSVWSGTDVTNIIDSRPAWNRNNNAAVPTAVTRVVFDPSFADVKPTNCSAWFYRMDHLASVEGLEYLNTSAATMLSSMFGWNTSLTTVDVSGFDVSNVTSADWMFNECINLTTIYCGNDWSSIASSAGMFSNCKKLKGAVNFNQDNTTVTMANPEKGYFTWPESTVFLTLNEKGNNSSLLKRYEGQEVQVKYSRRLTAQFDSDGNFYTTPFTVCLPYDLDLSAAVSDGQVEIYTLAAVSANSGQFTFVKLDITTLEAGMPYLLRVMKSSIGLSATRVTIKATKPKSTKVYSSLSQWRREEGTVVGYWTGTFDCLTADDAADESAFGLEASDESWSYYDYGGTATIPGFHCYLSSPDGEKKTYTSRFTE